MKLVGVMVVATLGACGSKSTPPAAPVTLTNAAPVAKDPPKPDCDRALANAITVGGRDPDMKIDAAVIEKLKTIMVQHCKADAWPDDAISCYAGATEVAQLSPCLQHIPKDKLDLMMKDVMAVMMANAKVDTAQSAGSSQTTRTTDLALPTSPNTPPVKTTRPISGDTLKKLSEQDFAGFTKDVRRLDGKILDVRYMSDDRPKIWAQIEIRGCDRKCVPMQLDKWKARDDLKWSIEPDALKSSPDLQWQVGATDTFGQTMIDTLQLGIITHADGGAYTYAYTLYYNDGVNQARVLARYADDPNTVEDMQKAVPVSELERVAKAFMGAFTHGWGS